MASFISDAFVSLRSCPASLALATSAAVSVFPANDFCLLSPLSLVSFELPGIDSVDAPLTVRMCGIGLACVLLPVVLCVVVLCPVNVRCIADGCAGEDVVVVDVVVGCSECNCGVLALDPLDAGPDCPDWPEAEGTNEPTTDEALLDVTEGGVGDISDIVFIVAAVAAVAACVGDSACVACAGESGCVACVGESAACGVCACVCCVSVRESVPSAIGDNTPAAAAAIGVCVCACPGVCAADGCDCACACVGVDICVSNVRAGGRANVN